MRTDPDEAKSGYLSIVPRGPGSEVPTMFGSLSARISSNGAEIPKKMCSLLLALLLALSLMPNAAWAAGAENVPGTSSAEASALTNSSLGAGDAVAEGSLPGDTVVAGADTSEGSNSRNESAAEGTPPESVLPVDVAASPGHVSGEGDVSSPSAGSDMFTEETPLPGAELAEPSPVVLYAASLAKNGEGTYVFSVGDTIEARAKEKGAPTGVYIEPEKLTYQWQVSTDNVTFTEVSEQTTSELVLDAGYQGRYVKCVISAKVGDSKAATRVTKVIGAAGSINVTSVAMNKSGNLYPGDVVMASATSGSDDVTSNEKVIWSWYYSNTAAAATTRIEGATTSSLTVTEDMMGAYLVARADGGFGEVKSSAAGPVVQKGAFKLYKVEASGSAEVGKTLSALAYSDDDRNTPVSDQAVVAYQWQYADTSTTSDAAFKDIPGATSKSYTIAADMLGKYVRVKAKSLNTSVSTSKPYGGSTQPVSPLGPVKLEGAYELSSVKLSSTGQAMQAGSVLTPVAQYKKGYYEYDVPADAKVSYTWLVADAQLGDFAPLTSGVDASGKLTLDAALAGKWVKVSAHALINNATSTAYRVLAEDTYDLLRATLTPSSGDLFTGSEITAKVQAKNLTSVSTGDDVSDKVTLVWSVGDAAQGSFVPLGGADSKTLTIPAAAAGKFLKVTATSGDSSVEVVTSKAVVDSDTLEGAAKKLEAKSFKATPAYGQDTNINEVVRAKLAELGYDDIAVTTKSAVARQTNENATVGVSVAPGETNGDITYFFMDPDTASSSYFSYTQLRQFNFTFVLARNGQSYEYKPSYVGTIPWDEAQVSALLNKKAETLNIGFASSDEANAVTKNLTLPYKLKNDSGATKSWSSVSWISSDTAVVKVSGSGWSDSTGAVTRTAADRAVTLTATVSAGGISSSGGPSTTVEKSFDVTVKGDPDKVAAEKAALEQKVQTNFTYDNLKLSETGAAIDKDAVSGDITLPNPRTIGVDGKYYAVTYSASNDTVVIDTYRGSVYRPLSGAEKAPVDLTVTVTDKSNPEITATKTFGIQIAPLEQSDITRELELMEAAKAGYFNAVANGQTTDAVTQNLHAFQKAYFDASGSLAWAYDYASTNAAGNGIVPVDLEGYDPMGSGGWRLFKSSRPGVVSHENLLVKQPEYNTQVILSSRLSSEKYARYAQRYPENASFQKLANQNVSATFTVVGTSGVADPQVVATCSVLGQDKDGKRQTWIAASPYTLNNGASAADLSEAAFDAAGLVHELGVDGCYLASVTSPFDAGQTLGRNNETGEHWQLFINGKAASSGAGEYVLQAGDSVVWFYSTLGVSAPTDDLSVTCSVIGVDERDSRQTWASADTFAIKAGSTAADVSEELFGKANLSTDTGSGAYGWYLNSITSPYTGETLASREVSPGVWAYWQLFINGKLATVGAGGYVVQAGDEITWCYGSDGTLPGQVASTCKIIGKDANGNAQVWATDAHYIMVEGATAADLSEQAFVKEGLSATYTVESWGWSLSAITSPFDSSQTLGYDSATGAYWQLFINGKSSLVGAGAHTLKPSDEVVWCYTADSALPNPDDSLVINPDAPRPSYDSSWAGFGSGSAGGAVVERPTPTESTEHVWIYDFKEGAPSNASVSEPLVVNGSIYLVVSGELRVIDTTTGAVKKDKSGRELRAQVGSTSAYCNRPVYSNGIVVVPSDNGSLTAFTADTLTCVWKTPPLDVGDSKLSYQSLSSLTVNGSYVYAAFTMVGAGGVGVRGTLVCVNLADGAIMWTQPELDGSESAGYYWAGAASSDDDLVIGDESGDVKLVDGKTGSVLSSVSIGTSVRAGIVSVPQTTRGAEMTFVAVSTDGVLHVIARNGDTLSKTGSVKFASKSTSTPASTGAKVFVCGLGVDGYGTLSVIDLGTLSVVQTVRGGKGEAQSSPLVSVQEDGTYVYFTCNGIPGGVYGYRLGDVEAYTLFMPGNGQQSYGLGSVISDDNGNLYYTNDSGHLFALKGQDGVRVTFESNGGSSVVGFFVASGKAVERPNDPVKSGFTFVGWFSDAACTTAWDFATEIKEDTTLYAKWAKVEASDGNTSGDGSGGQSGKDGSGFMLAANAPLTKTADKSTNAETKVTVDASSKSASKDVAEALATMGDEGDVDEQTLRGVNPWAAGGIVAGVVGLVGATVYLVRTRRKLGAPDMMTEGK